MRLSRSAPSPDPDYQRPRTTEQGGAAAHARRWHFPKCGFMVRLVRAILMERNDEWETGQADLTFAAT